MNIRCIKYHLEVLIFAFNKRKISTTKFRENFMRIKPFTSINKKTVEIIILGTEENKKRMNQNEIECITTSLMYELDISYLYKRNIEKLVEQHWPKKGIIYRFICHVVEGATAIDETKHYYVVIFNDNKCQRLMEQIEKQTLIQREKLWINLITGSPMMQMKIWK